MAAYFPTARVRDPKTGNPILAQVPNLWQVSPTFFRSAQPLSQDWPAIARQLGITTVIDLREKHYEHDPEEEYQLVKAAGMNFWSVPMSPILPPQAGQFSQLMVYLDDDGGKQLVHCKEGKDRTGAVCACYQMIHGATPEQAWSDFWKAQPLGPLRSKADWWLVLPAMEYARTRQK